MHLRPGVVLSVLLIVTSGFSGCHDEPEIQTVTGGNISIMPHRLPFHLESLGGIWDGDDAYLFGGLGYGIGTGCLQSSNKIIKYSFSEGAMVLPADLGYAYGRSGSTAVWNGTTAFIIGGDSYGCDPSYDKCFDDILVFDPKTGNITGSWELPYGLMMSSSVWIGEETLIFGGAIGCGVSTDVIGPMSVYDENFIYVFCGEVDNFYGTSHIVRVDTDGTVVKLRSGLPETRGLGVAVWTGTNALIFGAGVIKVKTY